MGGCMSSNINSKYASKLDLIGSTPMIAALITIYLFYKVENKNYFDFFLKFYLTYISILIGLVIAITKISVADCKDIGIGTIIKQSLLLHITTIASGLVGLLAIFIIYTFMTNYKISISIGITVFLWLITYFFSSVAYLSYPCVYSQKCMKENNYIITETPTPTQI